MRPQLDVTATYLFRKLEVLLPLMKIPMPPLTLIHHLFKPLHVISELPTFGRGVMKPHFSTKRIKSQPIYTWQHISHHVEASFHLQKTTTLKSVQAITFPSFFSHHIYQVNQFHAPLPPLQWCHLNSSTIRASNVGVHLDIELEVGDHVREIDDSDISATCGSGDNLNKASAEPKFENTERAMILTIG